MALEQLVNGMTGQQLANTIKNNFDKVLDVESAENKAENAGKALKTDYDATRYVEMELADGTPIRMRWDVFCQAMASVVAGGIGIIRQSNGGYLLGNKDSAGLFLVVAESDYALYSYNMIYGTAVSYNRIAGELRIENVNNYGTVVSPNGIGFYAVRFER